MNAFNGKMSLLKLSSAKLSKLLENVIHTVTHTLVARQ
jgi:hypothetical protein